MPVLNKYSNKITITEINGLRFYFYQGNLKAFYVPSHNRFFIEEPDMRKRTLIEALESSYEYQHKGASICGCYSLNNLLCNITYNERL